VKKRLNKTVRYSAFAFIIISILGSGYLFYAQSQGVTLARAEQISERYLSSLELGDLKISEVMEFEHNYYVVYSEESTDMGAMEMLIDKTTGQIYPEYGPNMMWNLKYGHGGMMGSYGGMMGSYGSMMESSGGMMGGFGGMMSGSDYRSMMGGYGGIMSDFSNMMNNFGNTMNNFGNMMSDFGEMMGEFNMMGSYDDMMSDFDEMMNDYDDMMSDYNDTIGTYYPEDYSGEPITEEEAIKIAQDFLDTAYPGAEAEDPHPFYGYYTIHTVRDGQIFGMLSVNSYTGDVWYHNWHGEYIQSIETH
jgi:hypothetical protein